MQQDAVSENKAPTADLQYDVIILGTGAAGMTAAIVAAQAGMKILLLEKTAWIGGTTAFSGGGVWVPCHSHLPALRQSDTASKALEYLAAVTPGALDLPRATAYVEAAPEMLAYMEAHSAVRFTPIRLPDYFPDSAGALAGRSLLSTPYDGRMLGPALRKLRRPLSFFTLFGSLQIDQRELARFLNAFQSSGDFRHVARRMMQFVADLLRNGRSCHLANGNALAARLLRTVLDEKIEIRRNIAVTDLVFQDGKVVGVAAGQANEPTVYHARRAVILATGGFNADQQRMARLSGNSENFGVVSPSENLGDGIALAEKLEARLDDHMLAVGVLTPVSILRDKNGKTAVTYPHFGTDRAKPGCIIVNAAGRRFLNEAMPYQQFVEVMAANNTDQAWLIGDAAFLQRYGMGLARPFPFSNRKLLQANYLFKAPAIADLAVQIQIDPNTLNQSLEEFNILARSGTDTAFGRGANRYDRSLGDPKIRPNPNLRPLETGPFYAVAIHAGSISSLVGLQTSVDGEVLDGSGAAIPGLYAAGLDQQSPFRGMYPSGGASLGAAMTTAFRCARHVISGVQQAAILVTK